MKKRYAVLLSLVLLTGCTSTGLKEDKVLYAINGVETKDSDFYESMKKGDDGTIAIKRARQEILDASEVDTEALDVLIQGNIAELESMFGENLLPYLQSMGFLSVEDFIEKQVKPSLIIEVLATEQLKKDKDSLIKKYQYKNIEYIATSNKEILEKALVSINNGAKISDIELDDSSKYTKESHSLSSEVPSKTLSNYLKKDQKEGISSILYDEESNLYFIVYNNPIDLDTQLDEVIAQIMLKEDYIRTFSGQLFQDNGFKVYDADLKAKMKKSHPDYVN